MTPRAYVLPTWRLSLQPYSSKRASQPQRGDLRRTVVVPSPNCIHASQPCSTNSSSANSTWTSKQPNSRHNRKQQPTNRHRQVYPPPISRKGHTRLNVQLRVHVASDVEVLRPKRTRAWSSDNTNSSSANSTWTSSSPSLHHSQMWHPLKDPHKTSSAKQRRVGRATCSSALEELQV